MRKQWYLFFAKDLFQEDIIYWYVTSKKLTAQEAALQQTLIITNQTQALHYEPLVFADDQIGEYFATLLRIEELTTGKIVVDSEDDA